MGETSPRPVPRWLGRGLVVAGLAVNELTLELTVVPDEEIGSSAVRLGVVGFQLACLALGAWVLVRRPRSRIPWHGLALGALSGLLAWFACFAVLDTQFPGALTVPGVRYFELRQRFESDSVLVLVPREERRVFSTRFFGDMHDPGDDLSEPGIPYVASYNARGFRRNSGGAPYDAVLVGDSFVEFGESDSTTLSELVREETGLSTYNLGRAWYGPYQYLEVLRRYGVQLRPTFALLCFFEGNDLGDIRQYEQWREGGDYYRYGVLEQSLPERFATASGDLMSVAWTRLLETLGGGRRAPRRVTARVALGDSVITMKFAYWPDRGAADGQLHREEWRSLRSLLIEFQRVATENGIVPVTVFVPEKASVYGPYMTEVIDTLGRSREPRFPPRPAAAIDLDSLSLEVGMDFVDLSGPLSARARRLPLLYYRADTHWTETGRRIAAREIAAYLARRTERD